MLHNENKTIPNTKSKMKVQLLGVALLATLIVASQAHSTKAYPICCKGSGAGSWNLFVNWCGLATLQCTPGGYTKEKVESNIIFDELLKGQSLAKKVIQPSLTYGVDPKICPKKDPDYYLYLGPSGVGKSLAATLTAEARHGTRCCCTDRVYGVGLPLEATSCGIGSGFRLITYASWMSLSKQGRVNVIKELQANNPCPTLVIDDIMTQKNLQGILDFKDCIVSPFIFENAVDCHGLTIIFTAHIPADDFCFYGGASNQEIDAIANILNTSLPNNWTDLAQFHAQFPFVEVALQNWFGNRMGGLLKDRLVPFTSPTKDEIESIIIGHLEAASCFAPSGCTSIEYDDAFHNLAGISFSVGRKVHALIEGRNSLSARVALAKCNDSKLIIGWDKHNQKITVCPDGGTCV